MKAKCMNCQYYYITFNQNTPKGCKAYGIQSAQMPSVVVKQANNGSECIGFKEKPARKKSLDLNDSKNW